MSGFQSGCFTSGVFPSAARLQKTLENSCRLTAAHVALTRTRGTNTLDYCEESGIKEGHKMKKKKALNYFKYYFYSVLKHLKRETVSTSAGTPDKK